MKYSIDKKFRTRGEIYSLNSGLTRTLNNRQARVVALLLLIAAIAAAGVIGRGLLLPDSSFIISGEEKPQTEQTVSDDSAGSGNPTASDGVVQTFSTRTVSDGGFRTFAVQVPSPGQIQSPSTAAVSQPVTGTTGGMGGGTPDTPDTDCGCVNRAVDKATGTVAETLSPLPGF